MTQNLSGVLLVEDDEGDALLVRECLREAGLADDDVTWCRTLAEGVEALADEPSCVLLDLGLPDADGLDGAAHRGRRRGQPTTPVIVLTGRHDRVGVDAVAAGAQDYLIKDDITPELLDRTIRYAVQRRQTQLTEVQLREERLLAAENSRLERGLLPKPLLRSDFVTCASHYRPGRARAVLGGDFYDVVETPDGRVRAVIGDVMGHGPDEAALGVHLRVAWRSAGAGRRARRRSMLVTPVPAARGRERRRHLRHRLRRHHQPRPRRRDPGRRPPAAAALPRRSRQLPRRRVRAAARDPRRAAAAGLAGHPHRAGAGRRAASSTPTACSTPTDRSTSLTSVGLDELLEVATEALAAGELARRPARDHRRRGRRTQAVDDTALVVLSVGEPSRGRGVTEAPGWSLRRRVNRAIVGVLVLLMVLVVIVVYFIDQAEAHRRRRSSTSGTRRPGQPEHADRHGQPGDRRPRLRARQGRGLAGALQPRTAAGDAAPRARCASTCSSDPDLLAELVDARAPPSSTWRDDGRRAGHRRRCGPATPPPSRPAGSAEAQGRLRPRSAARVARSSPTRIDAKRTQVADDRERAFTYVWCAVALGTAGPARRPACSWPAGCAGRCSTR